MTSRKSSLTDDALTRAATDALDDSVRDYDAATRHRLRAAREAAVEAAARPDLRSQLLRWMGLGAAFASCAMFWVLWTGGLGSQAPVSEVPEPELIAMAGETDLYQDLEFYQWLAQQ